LLARNGYRQAQLDIRSPFPVYAGYRGNLREGYND